MSCTPSKSTFASILIDWFRAHGRELPWRNIDDPYKVWISEVILQQTRVNQGMSYYLNFIEHFPTVQALAAAPLDSVMKVWQGLGYYTRARNLHRAAQVVVEQRGGQLPCTYRELLKLPGLGPYAAGAVASFAFHEAVPAIDGNVYRVLARVFGVFDSPGKAAGKKAFHQLCSDVLDREQPHVFNQAIIDFGALQCTPGRPDCPACPFEGQCYAEANAMHLSLPAKERATKLRTRHLHFIMPRHGDSTFIQLRQGKDIWHSLYQFPLVETPRPLSQPEFLALEEVGELLGSGYTLLHVSEVQRQLLSHQELLVTFYIVQLPSIPYALLQDYQMVKLADLEGYQVPVMLGDYMAAEAAEEYFF